MPTLHDIHAQVAALPDRYIFFTHKEIRALPKVLAEGERILALTSGMMEGVTWLAVCTPSRLIFLNCGMVFGVRQVQIPLERVQSIDHEFAILFGYIRVWDGASYFTLRMVLKRSIEPFVKTVQEAMARIRTGSAPHAAAPADVATQLEKLATLREKGFLTDEEFQQQKKKLLG